jgi:peptidoglycan L-alanyl-D-glutamate endopeptidase CwlK
MERVVEVRDISIICGIRNRVDQNQMFDEGKSKLRWPDGKHNVEDATELSDAVDIVPWPEQYSDSMTMIHVAGIVMGIAAEMNMQIRWGGDWNRNADLNDQEFKDLWHFERVDL